MKVFNETGMHTFDLGHNKSDMIYDVAVNSSGQIVLVGSFLVESGICDVAIAVLESNGQLASGFGSNGILLVDADKDDGTNTGNSFAKSVVLDANNNLFIGTQIGMTAEQYDFGVVSISPQGTINSAFGTDGIVSMDINNGQNTQTGIMLDSENRLLTAVSAPGVRNPGFCCSALYSPRRIRPHLPGARLYPVQPNAQ